MAYFEYFPMLSYSLDGGETRFLVPDIMRRVKFSDIMLEHSSFFSEYYLQDSDNYESLAFNIYGDANLHWIILMANNIVDPLGEFPKSANDLEAFCIKKYGSLAAAYKPHHYVNSDGLAVDSNYPSAYPVSNFEYESELNEAKRKIRIVKPEYVGQLITMFKGLINE